MTNPHPLTEHQITLATALDLVSFGVDIYGKWQVKDVKGDVCGDVKGSVRGDVRGDVRHNVEGGVFGTIDGKHWLYVETPKQKLKRLIEEKGNEELLKAYNQVMRPTQEDL